MSTAAVPRAPMRPLATHDTTIVAATLVGVVAAIVSETGAWIPSLWGDEAAIVLSASRPIPSLLTMLTHVDAVHGASYVALHFWIDLFGASAFAVRVPSALAAGIGAAALVWLGARLRSLRGGCSRVSSPRCSRGSPWRVWRRAPTPSTRRSRP